MQKRKYSVCIIGCGSIGSNKPDEYDRPGGDAVLTHAHAFWKHPDTQLKAFIDRDFLKASNAVYKWMPPISPSYAAFESLEYKSLLQSDIVVVATPTATHRDTLMQVLDLKPKLVVAEKPFCSTLEEAREVHDAYKQAGTPILVDYIRRFDPTSNQVLEDLRDGKYGHIWHVRCLYGRGLRRDGCHGLDIFNWVLGQPTGLHIFHDGRIDDAPEAGDASHHLILTYKKDSHPVTAQMVPADSRAWGAFEMEFICEHGVVSFPQWGKRVAERSAEAETTFGQYKVLSWPPLVATTALNKALLYLADNAVRHLRDGEPLKCTSEDALRVHEILEQVK